MFSNLAQHFKKTPQPIFSPVARDAWPPSEANGSTAMPTDVLAASPAKAVAPPLDARSRPHFEQPRSDLAGFFIGLRQAADRFAMSHIAPLAALDPSVRFQLRTVTVRVKPESDRLLRELQALEHHIVKTAAVNCLKQCESAEQIDLNEFFGIIVAAGDEVAAGDAVMTLATVGVERINLEFEFDGEHISVSQPHVAAVMESAGGDFALHLLHPDGRREPVPLSRMSLLIGTAPYAGLRVQDTYVSREHATLFYDQALCCWALQDHSRHGTWVNGKPLGQEGRCLLHGKGQIRLASPDAEVATVIEFSHPALEHLQSTPLIEASAPLQTPLKESDNAVVVPVPSVVTEQTYKVLARETDSAPNATLLTELAHPVQETQLCDSSVGTPLAWLQVRTLDGVRTEPIFKLPFVVGREPLGDGFLVDADASFVSREHLKLVSFHHNCFTIENGGLGRNNTYKKGVLQDSRLLYQPVSPDCENGWIVLGGKRLDAQSIEVRLLKSRPGEKM